MIMFELLTDVIDSDDDVGDIDVDVDYYAENDHLLPDLAEETVEISEPSCGSSVFSVDFTAVEVAVPEVSLLGDDDAVLPEGPVWIVVVAVFH